MTNEQPHTQTPGRQVCTAERPMPKNAPGQWAHLNARIIGETSDGAGDHYGCPHCGTTWTDWYDDN